MVSIGTGPYPVATMPDSPPDALSIAAVRVALSSRAPRVRAAALAQIADRGRVPVGGRRELERLLADALRDDDADVRRLATRALARIATPAAVAGLIEASSGDPSPRVRREAMAALARILELRHVDAEVAGDA